MQKVKDIFQSKTLIILIGAMIGAAILAQPVMRNYCDTICQIEQEDQADQSTEDQEKVASLEALVPTPQIEVASTEYSILDEFKIEIVEDTFADFVQLEHITDKLVRILFNFIIAPNAP